MNARDVAKLLAVPGDLGRLVDAANAEALDRWEAATARWTGVASALEVVPRMTRTTILHAGPELAWDRMCPLLQGAVAAAATCEGLAPSVAEGREAAAAGAFTLRGFHDADGLAPMTGVVTASMPVFVVENAVDRIRRYCPLNEGLGKVLRYGAHGPDVFERLRWMRDELAPVLGRAVEAAGGLDVLAILADALHMGDECHNRQKAGTSLLVRRLAPWLHADGIDPRAARRVLTFLAEADVFFLNLAMPACRAIADSAAGVAGSSLVTCMAMNGTEFGLRLAATGDRWYRGPAASVEGRYLDGYGPEAANPGIGDSTITETVGLGAFAMAGAPALVRYTGGTPVAARAFTEAMYTITVRENRRFTIPALDFRGTPTGIDARSVVLTGTTPVANLGIAHRQPGLGQIGAGYVRAPLACFEAAVEALFAAIDDGEGEGQNEPAPTPMPVE
jgi:hypothetical protein